MIERTLIDYLNSALDVPVSAEVPKDPEESYVIVEKTGSAKVNHIKEATFAIQSYAPTMYDAAVLNELVKVAMEDIILETNITKAELDGDYNFTNPNTRQYRYQAVYTITYMEA